MDVSALYEERLQRFDDVMSRKIPDRVPVIPNMNTWMYHFAGVSVKKGLSGGSQRDFQRGQIHDGPDPHGRAHEHVQHRAP